MAPPRATRRSCGKPVRRRTTNFVVVSSHDQQEENEDSIDVATRHWAGVFARKAAANLDLEYFLQFLPTVEADTSSSGPTHPHPALTA